MEIRFEDFIPLYTDTSQKTISNKLEFNNLTVKTGNEKVGKVFNHQEFISRLALVSKKIFVFHEPGTGKTIAFLSAADRLLKNGNIKKVIYITTATLVPKVIEELMVFFKGEYSDNKKEDNWYGNLFEFHSVDSFPGILRKISFSYFNGSLIIFDEVHVIANADYSGDKGIIFEFFEKVDARIILGSGTPMKDDVVELITEMKLLGITLDTGDLKGDVYLNLKNKLSGIVSMVKPVKDLMVKKVYFGEEIGGINFLTSKMTPEQEKAFLTVSDDVADSQKLQISNIYYSVGKDNISIGNKIEALLKNNSEFKDVSKIKLKDKNNDTIEHDFGKPIKELFIGVKNVEKFSPKMAKILETVQRVRGSCACYCYFVFVGLYPLAAILKANGFEEYTGSSVSTKKPRFAVYSRENSKIHQNIIKTFNSSENKNGEYIKIILLSSVGEQGISLKNVLHYFFLNGSWNRSTQYQIESRIFRLYSYVDLGNVTVTLYNCAALTSTGESSDVKMYQTAMVKDREIKKVERALKLLALDCGLQYERNLVIGTDYTEECDYDICEYKCDFPSYDTSSYKVYRDIGGDITKSPDTDKSTFLYHNSILVQNLVIEIKKLLAVEGKIKINYLVKTLKSAEILDIFESIDYLVQNRIECTDRFGRIRFCAVIDDHLFLTSDPFFPGRENEWYLNNIPVEIEPLTETTDYLELKDSIISGKIEKYKKFIFKISKTDLENNIKLLIDEKNKVKRGKPTDSLKLASQKIKFKNDGDEFVVFHNYYVKEVEKGSGYISKLLHSECDLEKLESGFFKRIKENYSDPEYVVLQKFIQERYTQEMNVYKDRALELGVNVFGSILLDETFRLHDYNAKEKAFNPGITCGIGGNINDRLGLLQRLGGDITNQLNNKEICDRILTLLKEKDLIYTF